MPHRLSMQAAPWVKYSKQLTPPALVIKSFCGAGEGNCCWSPTSIRGAEEILQAPQRRNIMEHPSFEEILTIHNLRKMNLSIPPKRHCQSTSTRFCALRPRTAKSSSVTCPASSTKRYSKVPTSFINWDAVPPKTAAPVGKPEISGATLSGQFFHLIIKADLQDKNRATINDCRTDGWVEPA